MTLIYAYIALAFSAFTSATLLPGTSEAAFAAFIYRYPQQIWGAWLCAGLLNGLGSMVSYAMGRLLPDKKRPSEKTLRYQQRYGTWLLLLAWLPIIGDALPLAAGWLRLDWRKCAVMLVAGKMLRYALIGWGVSAWV
ncbi:YqaA family protein [Neisseria perflava]|uniref:YqaA family protein n=1 Tax=Neisseria perflava TaxID=33053 RepID=UPI00209E67DD|nr:YqaA family protein [Neisseria perflava]MCP1660339.1 membrane protein YqaA with SNARE-associated domain [Neisseria perflava]MCP1772340.1 membrane protein YqaA with SNARE-associated domain [Neisseria perflava]